jgi:hypothetical protein
MSSVIKLAYGNAFNVDWTLLKAKIFCRRVGHKCARVVAPATCAPLDLL